MKNIGGYYVDEKALSSRPMVVSGGGGCDLTFELRMIAEHGAMVNLYDPTPLALDYAAQFESTRLIVHPVGLSVNNTIDLFVTTSTNAISSSEFPTHPNNEGQNKITVSCTAIDELIRLHGPIDVLKLDIEGSEVELLCSVTESQARFIKQITFECHHHIIPQLPKSEMSVIYHLASVGYKYLYSENHVHLLIYDPSAR